MYLECLILQVFGCSECLILHILLKASVLQGSTHGSRFRLSSICWLAAQPRKAPVLLPGLENLKNSQIHRCLSPATAIKAS